MKFLGVLKNIFIISAVCLTIIYLAAYLFLPYFLNKKDYSKIITENFQKQTGLVLLINGYKLSVSPLLEINLKADGIQLFYPDKKQIMDVKNANIYISGLNLLIKEVKLNKISAEQFQFSTKLLENGKTTFQNYLDKNIQKGNTDLNFSESVPNIYIKKYIVKIKDENSGQKFKFTGENFNITRNRDFKYLTLAIRGNLYCFEKKYVSYDIKLVFPKMLFNEVNKQLFDISFDDLYRYDFFARLKADLRLENKNNTYNIIKGKADIDDFVITLGKNKLPKSYFHINFDNGYALVTSKFYTAANEKTDIKAKVKTTKPHSMEIDCKCEKADITNLQNIAIAVFKLLKIKNNFNEFKSSGTISANFSIKTDLKNLKSNGTLKIKNADISHKNMPFNITGINSTIDFSNNSIKINRADIYVNKQPLSIDGKIDNRANAVLNINAQNLSLCSILKAFPLIKLPENINIISGLLSFNSNITGSLSSPSIQLKSTIKNLSAKEKSNNIYLTAKEVFINSKIEKTNYLGNINIKKITLKNQNIPNSTNALFSESVSADIDNKNIKINPSRFTTGNANLTLTGNIKNYLKNPETYITLKGTVDTGIIKSFVKDIKLYAKGYLPVNAMIKATPKIQNADIKILSNPQNYITPLIVNSFANTNMLTHITLKAENNSQITEDINMYYTPGLNSLLTQIVPFKYKKALSAKGKIQIDKQNTIKFNNLHIQIPENLNVSLPELNNAKADINANLILNGTSKNPELRGILHIFNLDIPQYFAKAQKAEILFLPKQIKTKINNLKIKATDISVETDAPYDFLSSNKINYAKIDAQYLDLEYLMALMEAMPLLNQAKYAAGIEFPYTITNGKLYIKSFKNGLIKADNVTADISAKKNILYFNNVFANAYSGKAAGKISYNFPYTTIKAKIQGRDMDAAAVSNALLPKEQRLSGKLNFDADVSMMGSDAKRQMETLHGTADIVVNNGHLGTLGRFEHFLYAQNLLSQRLIYASINSAKQAISPKDTGYFTYLKGTLRFQRSLIYLSPITTTGPQMSMYITGSMSLLNNTADLQILGRISSEVSNTLGDFGSITIKEFLDKHTKYGQSVSNLFNAYNIDLPEMDISKIPKLNPDLKYQTKNFRVIINGDTNSVKSVKSFTWINPVGTKEKILMQEAQSAIKEALPEQSGTKEKQNNPATQPAIEARPPLTAPAQKKPADFLDSIPDNFTD